MSRIPSPSTIVASTPPSRSSSPPPNDDDDDGHGSGSNGDVCPGGYREAPSGTCYRGVAGPKTVAEASAICSNLTRDGHLATIRSKADNDFAFSLCALVSDPKQQLCYIGLFRKEPNAGCSASNPRACNGDVACRCSFAWADGSDLSNGSYANWIEGRPFSRSGVVVRLGSAGWSDDASVATQRPFLCEGTLSRLGSHAS